MAFRMVWFDPRIIVDLNDTRQFVHLYRDQRDNFWFPDLYILNSIDIGVPKLTLDPILLRVYKDGRVESSIRKEIQSVCPMDFINYPVRNTSNLFLLKLIFKLILTTLIPRQSKIIAGGCPTVST